MRENRPYGSEGGESGSTGLPYPYQCPPSADTSVGWMGLTLLTALIALTVGGCLKVPGTFRGL